MTFTWILPVLVTTAMGAAECIQLLEAHIPQYAATGQAISLSCPFRLAWGERVYSSNWYWDGHEFYRFYPSETPPVQTFYQPHFRVDESMSNVSTVVLNRINREASGTYRCEISTEAPYFNTISYHALMMVADIPKHGPRITGMRDRYDVGDLIKIYCTLPRTQPEPDLTWYINGEEASPVQVSAYPGRTALEGSQTLVRGLNFKLAAKHMTDMGKLTVKCVASLANFYWTSDQRRLYEYMDAQASQAADSRAGGGIGSLLNLKRCWRLIIALFSLLWPQRIR